MKRKKNLLDFTAINKYIIETKQKIPSSLKRGLAEH
jgi:hypothetical protein